MPVGCVLKASLIYTLVLCSAAASEQWGESLPPVPVWSVQGNHYNIGLQIGSTFRSRILSAMTNNTFFNDRMLPYNQTTEGSSLYSAYFDTASKRYPQYMDELRGMADGTQMKFSEVFLWNLKYEWKLLLEPRSGTLPTPSCTDIFLANGKSVMVMGHNEDGDTIDITTGYIIEAQIMEESGRTEEFYAFCYAGDLCGKAFGYNGKGVVTTVNALFPKHVNTSAMARNFINRATLTSSYEEIQKILQEVPCSSGFSLNVGTFKGDMTISNFEVAPSGVVETKVKGYGYHFNMYLHSDVPQYEDPSSEHRLARVRELPPPTDARDITTILGDTEDKKYPIYRTATPPDTAVTLATGLFDMSKGMFYLFRGNPADTDPVLIPLPVLQ